MALTPQAPFTTLSVSNDLLVEGKLKLGSITLSVVNGALKIDGDVYSTGGMSAYGDGTNNGGGGGLVASVKSYTDIIKGTYTDNDLASIPNAYAIKALSNRIDNISSELGGLSLDWANITGKPSAFTPSAHTHKWVDITDRITKVSQLTNDSGYTTNKGTVTSVKLTLPTGLSLGTTKEITTSGTFAISLTSGYSIPTTSKQGQWDSAYNWYKLMTTDEETADGVINKWNEVVDFLAGIAQTDSLDSILSGINKSITDETNRAKKAEGANATNIATNKANITTLQGYFTNGSAKSAIKLTNARKLWGNSFDGTADISGSIVVPSGKYITIGNIKLEYDATNKALKITNTSTNEVANLYTSGGVSAYGVGTTSSGSTGGGGLNGTVKSYNDAKSLTSESLSEVASAYSVAALYSSINDAIGRINTLEGGSATSIEVAGSGNAVTGVSKSGTKLTFTKGATFLTSHQDISGKSDKTHTHSVKINGVTKTIAATGGTAVDLGTYLTSHQSLAAYLKSADAEKTYSKLGHTHAFSEITGKPTTLAGYGVTDGVNTVTLSGSGNAVTSASIDGHTLTLTKGSTFSLSGHTHTFASLTSKPTTIAGYGITDAYTKAQVNSTVAKYLPLAGGTITGALTVNGIATFKSKVAIGDIYIINDGSGNLYVQKTDGKTAANFYATGGITAFGASSVSGGTGGGLNGSVLGFEKATAMTSADNGDSSKTEVSFLATAWSIKQLNDKINAFGTGVFSDYLTIAAAKATYQPKGSYLTSHQTIYGLTIQKNGTSLGTYTPNSAAKTINVTVPTKLSELSNDSGYTKNTGTVTSVAISVPTGLSVSGSPITTKGTIAIALASGYSIPTTAKQTNWDKVYNWYTGITATDTDDIINKWQEVIAFLDGISSSTDLNAIVDGINTSISNEVTRAKAAESTLTTNLNSEIKRAKSAESTLTTNLNAEITRAKSAESTLTTNLNNEITRAKNAENTLNNKFANYLPLAGGTMANKAYITFADSGSFSAGTGAQGDVGGLKWSGQSDYAWLYGSETGSDNFDLTLKFGDDNSNGFRILNKDGNQVIRLSAKGDVASQTVTIGGITLSYDSTNKAIKVNGNIYATGGISAYGTSSAGSGGGLSGSVLAWDSAIKMPNATNGSSDTTKTESSFLASAWSVKKLYDKVASLEGGSAMNVSVSGSGNAVTSISKSGTTISVVKGSTFSLSGHTHKWADITDRPSSLKNPSALSWSGYSSGSYDGSAAKSISIPNNTNQLTNGAGFITASASITGNAATATKVNHSLSVFGKSFNGSADVTVADTDLITSISTGTANLTDKTEILTSYASDNGFNDSNAKNKIHRRPASAIWGYINSKTISNADKLDNVHLNGIFTALSNTNNGVSMTIGTVAKSLENMQVYSATKLVTARNIALGHDFRGSANFDGSGNITINGHINSASINLSSTDPNPFKRIAHVQTANSWHDNALLLYLSQGYIGGNVGICRVEFRTNNVTETGSAGVNVRWLVRYGYVSDSVQVGYYSAKGNSYMDVFVKTTGGYQGTVIRCLQDSRGGINSNVSLFAATQTTEAYTSIEAAAKALYNLAYTSIVKGSDVGTVNYANSAGNSDTLDGIHANGLFTNLSNSGNNLSITIGGTNKTLTVKYAASAGNADTLDGVHASGLFTNLSNSGNNISITIGGTNKTLTAAYATNCDTVDGYHAQIGSSKPYGKIPVIGTDGVIELGHYIDFHHDNTTGSDYSVRLQTNGNHSNVVTLPTATGILALTSDNVASATKLQTARTIWGQSFNGTGNVSGALSGATTISASNTISTSLQNGALKIGNKSAPISAIDAQVIFNTGAAVRFGETAWDWDEWAGLKYTHSNKTVYLGIADGSVFNARNAQSGGKLQLKAIDRILFDSDDSFQIHCDNSNDYLRIGSSDNSGYVLVSDIGNWDTDDNGNDTNNWLISIDGSSWFKSIYCPSIYTAKSITSTSDKALLLSGNVIQEYHSGGSHYNSSITFNDTTLALSAYSNIGLTSSQGITIEGGSGITIESGSGTISMVALGGFDVTYRAASLSVSQTGASEYTWTFARGSIKTTGGITAYQSSDERLKHNIHGVDSLAIIKAMGGTVAFRYNEDNKASIGWIAQRVLHNTLMQDLVEKDDEGFLKINYWSPKLIAVAFGAIEQVDDEVAKLKARVRELENEVEQLKSDRL